MELSIMKQKDIDEYNDRNRIIYGKEEKWGMIVNHIAFWIFIIGLTLIAGFWLAVGVIEANTR